MGAGRARTRWVGLALAAPLVLLPLPSAPVAAVARPSGVATPSASHPRMSPALRGRIPDVDTDHLLVRFAATPSDLKRRMANAGASVERSIHGTRWTVLSTPHGSAREVRARLRRDSAVAQVEYTYRRHALSQPNDPKWSTAQQGYLAPLRVDRAWDVSKGSGVTVAVVDTGVDLNHPDLAGRLVAGRDIANNDATPQDDVGHGTMVAGIIAADRNNHRGGAGIAPLASIMPIKVLGGDGSGDDTDIAAGIDWARTHGADVINMSLGGPSTDVVLEQAVADAIAAGIVVVAAAGNDGAETVGYPASYPGVIAVSATTHTGALVAFSSYGERVDVAAPGLDITSTALGSSEAYDVESGTSFSSPIVAGIAALVRAHNPGFTGAQTRARLLDTARDVGPPGLDRAFGHGMVDALAAVDLTHPAAPHPAARSGSNEPNDVPDDASTLAVGATVSSAISPETDEDWYAVHFASTGWYNIAVSHGNGSLDHDMQPIVELYDSNHALEASQDLLGGDLLVPIDSIGDGFVRVRNRGGDTAPYTIHIKTTTAPDQFGDPIELYLGTIVSSVAVGDVNGDGRNDIAFLLGDSSQIPDTLVTLLQTSTRSFALGDVIATDATVGRALSIADLDGDNANDVALAVSGGVDIFTQSGGTLDPTATFVATASTPAEIAVAPVDGGADNDLVVGGPDGIHVYYGPAFASSDAVETTTAITHSLAVGDVNGNAAPDIVATAPGTVLVYTQAGAHTFVETSQVVTSARAIVTGDVNDDGDVDAVATVRSSAGRVRTLLNGDTLGALTTTESWPDAVAIADVDQDGRNDAVVLHDDSGDVGVFTQQNDGSLGDEEPFFFDDFKSAYGARALAVDDVDSDSYPDIVVATTFGISILIQNPPHLPTLSNTWIADTSPAALATNVASAVTPVLTLDHIAMNVDDTSVQLLDAAGNEVSQTPAWNLGGGTVTITPDAPLADGAYTVRVDGLSDGSIDEFGDYFLPFTVGATPDKTAPGTALVSPPTGYRGISAATLKFTSNDGTATFECSLDNEKYHSCTSPVHVDVEKGAHSFRVFARDAAGNEDATPAPTTWTFRPPPKGYWMVSRTGVVYHFGTVPGFGNAATTVAADIEPSKSGFGYWVVDAFGRVFAFGDAVARGNASGLLLGETVTSLSRTASGNGYWLFTSRGRVLPFGDAHFYGDLRARVLNGPIRDSVRTASGHGYFMVAADGGVFAFGDAVYKGSTGGTHISAPIRTLVADADGTGYWLVGADGSVYAFAATNRGSMQGVPLNRPIAGMVGFGNGYLMVGSDGGIFNFSNKPYLGSLGGNPPANPIVSVAVYG
jgi:type VII secretion-associated serine protease mycosin